MKNGRPTEHGYTKSSTFEPSVSGELTKALLEACSNTDVEMASQKLVLLTYWAVSCLFRV